MKNIKQTILSSLIILILSIIVFPGMATAQQATDSAISENQVKEKIKERLEQVVGDKLEQVKGLIEKQVAEKIYAYSGRIKKIDHDTLTLETAFGDKQVTIASQAAVLKVLPQKGKTEVEIEDLANDEFVIAMGMIKDDHLLGKRLVVSSPPAPSIKRKILKGKVLEIDDSKITFAENGEEKQTIALSSKTKLAIAGIEKPEIENIQVEDYLRAIVALDDQDSVDQVKTVLIIPGKINPAAAENEIEATPSAFPQEEEKEEE